LSEGAISAKRVKYSSWLHKQCQHTLLVYVDFLWRRMPVGEYCKRLPSPLELVEQLKLEPTLALLIQRPGMRWNDPASVLDLSVYAKDLIAATPQNLKSNSPLLYTCFWSLTLNDIFVPHDCYDVQMARLKKALTDLEDTQRLDPKAKDKDIKKWKENLALDLDKMEKEMKKQIENKKKIQVSSCAFAWLGVWVRVGVCLCLCLCEVGVCSCLLSAYLLTCHTYMQTYMHIYIQAYMQTHMHTYIYIYAHTKMHTPTHTYTHIKCILTHAHAYTKHMHTHTNTLEFTHTYIQARIEKEKASLVAAEKSYRTVPQFFLQTCIFPRCVQSPEVSLTHTYTYSQTLAHTPTLPCSFARVCALHLFSSSPPHTPECDISFTHL